VSWQAALTLAVPASVAIVGLFAAYITNLRLAQRSAQLDRVSHQLSDFYGPLYALSSAANISWGAFRATHRPRGPYWGDPSNPVSDADAAAWRLWMSQVFMPLNRQMRDLVVTNAQLLDEDQMPKCLLTLCAHVAAYETILTKWAVEDFSEHAAPVPFPRKELTEYAARGFELSKSRQQWLLSHRRLLVGFGRQRG